MTAVTRPLPSTPTATRWALDASASKVEFSVRQLWGLSTVHGGFDRFEGELVLGADGAGRAELHIEAASIRTGNRRRDRHLRAPDYFDCERNPHVRYVAAVATLPGGGFRLAGELEAAGRSIPLRLRPAVDGGDERLELSVGANLDARELGMTWSPAGNLATPVTLTVHACLRRAA